MTPLEKILEKCAFDHDAKFNLAELYCKAHPKEVSEGLYISGAFLENHLLMPIIRELCAELSNYIGDDKCYCTGDTDFNGPGQECKPCKTMRKLSRLADSEKLK